MSWQEAARCVDEDPELFHPSPGATFQIDAAKRVCAQCPVVALCLSEALEGRWSGIWGGATDDERHNMRRRASRRRYDENRHRKARA